jgi:hypothetical protein
MALIVGDKLGPYEIIGQIGTEHKRYKCCISELRRLQRVKIFGGHNPLLAMVTTYLTDRNQIGLQSSM